MEKEQLEMFKKQEKSAAERLKTLEFYKRMQLVRSAV